jgi:hypothetical protein
MTMKQQKTVVWHTVIVPGCILCLFALLPPQNYFNINAFRVNAPGTFENTPKNVILGPPQQGGDAGIDKNWKIAREYNLQFRWELFNIFNHPSFGNPNASNQISATGVNEGGQEGQIAATGYEPARVQQGAVNFTFWSGLSLPVQASIARTAFLFGCNLIVGQSAHCGGTTVDAV